MKKLERITLGHVTDLVNLVNSRNIIEVGKGIAKNTLWSNDLKISNSEEKKVVYTDWDSNYVVEKTLFLETLDEVLKQNKMYLSEVEYGGGNFFGHKIKGRFYKEKPE